MKNVSGISNHSYSIDSYGKFASGKRINKAADGAAELAQSEKLKTDITTNNVNVRNAKETQAQLNIEEGKLSGVTDYLQRIRELSVKASNGLYSQSDKQSIQDEIDQMKQGIAQLAGKDQLEALGINDYSVMGDFDMKAVDGALNKVLKNRSKMGAQSNGLDHRMANFSNAAYNLTASQSKIEDLDYGKAITEHKKNQTLQNYRMMMQKKQMEQDQTRMNNLFI